MSWEKSAKPGDEIVFIGYPEKTGTFNRTKKVSVQSPLAVGQVYVIRHIEIRGQITKKRWDGPSFFLGFVDPKYGDWWHYYTGFRPVEYDPVDADVSEDVKVFEPA